MHCPDCGMKASAGQKFCRACGFALEKVEQLIAEQKPSATDQTTEAAGRLSDDLLHKLEKWAYRALIALGGVFLSIILWAVIVNLMIKEGAIFAGSMILMTLISIILAIFIVYMKERKYSSSTLPNQQQRLPQGEDTAKMLSELNLETATSVTENTTAKLEEKIGTPVKTPQVN